MDGADVIVVVLSLWLGGNLPAGVLVGRLLRRLPQPKVAT